MSAGSGDGAEEVVGSAELVDVAELAGVKALLRRGRAIGVLAYDQVAEVLAPVVGPEGIEEALSIFLEDRIVVIGGARAEASPANADAGDGARDPVLGCLHRVETALLARAADAPAPRVERAAEALPLDPVLGCLRRIGAVLHPAAADEAGGALRDAEPRAAEAARSAGDAQPARIAPEPELDFDVVEAEPATGAATPAAAPPIPQERRAAPGPIRAAAEEIDEQVEKPAAARRSARLERGRRGAEDAVGARTAAALAARQQEVETDRAAHPRPGHGPLRLRDIAVPALAIVAFTGTMLGLVSLLTRDGPPGPARAASTASGGGTQQPAVFRSAPEGPALSMGPAAAVMTMPGHPAAPRLARALALASANREDVLNSTAEGARQAEGEVLEAFRLGASEIPGAWRVLADVYDANREWAQDSNGRAEYRRKEREALARALEGAPNDGEARYRYAMLLDDRGARVRELARAVRDNPNAIEPRRWLGEDLLVSGKVEEGARLLVETAQLCSPRELNVYGPSIAVLLQNHGRAPDAAEVRARMQQARQ